MDVSFFADIQNEINKINNQLLIKQIFTLEKLRESYIAIKNKIVTELHRINEDTHGEDATAAIKMLQQSFKTSISIYKQCCWGKFSALNEQDFPELYKLLTDKNGDLQRVHDDFAGTVAMMDFHGYTKFSNSVKYNKTPLMEFGESLPAKILSICKKCHSLVYELEGDAIIIIGPQNPYWVLTAVMSIMELARQKLIFENDDISQYYNLKLKNPAIQPFEMNASITSGGKIFINYEGNLIGSTISEASRILSIINMKKAYTSGIMISDKVARELEKSVNIPQIHPIDLHNVGNPYLIDVKGMRVKIRELTLEQKSYAKRANQYSEELYKLLKIKNPSKWFNILVLYVKLTKCVLEKVDVSVTLEDGVYNSSHLIYDLDLYTAYWNEHPSAEVIRHILSRIDIIYSKSNDVRDTIAIYREYVNDNFELIINYLDNFYNEMLDSESKKDRRFQALCESYRRETDRLRSRYLPRRIFETVLANSHLIDNMQELPYIGKK
ncbi:MAG: hypothetical protein J1G30_04970 [Spirochaetales bacterium]|nr:hypothetical protein [Spirochaetales bacterium]